MEKFLTRMGDGFRVEMAEGEIRRDIEEATQDASKRAKIPPLTEDEIDYLKRLRFNGRHPTPLFYYRELQNLRDPLHFRDSMGEESGTPVATGASESPHRAKALLGFLEGTRARRGLPR